MKNVNENIARGWFVTTVVDAYIREEEKAEKNCVQENKFIFPQELQNLAKEGEEITEEEWWIWDGLENLKREIRKVYRYVHENFKIGKPFRFEVDDTEIVIQGGYGHEAYAFYIDLEN